MPKLLELLNGRTAENNGRLQKQREPLERCSATVSVKTCHRVNINSCFEVFREEMKLNE